MEKTLKQEIHTELTDHIIPFWDALRDEEHGGFYGRVNHDLTIDHHADKGGVLHSRILWFFSEAGRVLQDEQCLMNARHAFRFLKEHLLDGEYGGVMWTTDYRGEPADASKHAYCQAFAIYGLSAWYRVSGEQDALTTAMRLFELLETRMRDPEGYGEAFERDFSPQVNDKLSENGVLADRTMNTLLHVIEAYTELLRVSGDDRVRTKLTEAVRIMMDRVFDPAKGRLEVFFDKDYHSLIDLYSYGHDIEAAWLLDRAAEVLGDPVLTEKVHVMTAVLEDHVLREGFDGEALTAECEEGRVLADRIWWVQAEAVNGFLHAWKKRPERTDFLDAARREWQYIREHVIDRRPDSEWLEQLDKAGRPDGSKPMAGLWKCPYHNGRMCLEFLLFPFETGR
ncbi:MAG: AGE family epimerase/isomerase [Blautia sp.]|nr:AGE family epimerase/isomerase [Blautia sp.]